MFLKKNLTLLLLVLSVSLAVTAAPRERKNMQTAAAQLLNQRTGGAMAPQHQQLKELRTSSAYTIYGYEQGGFAVMSNDDLLPEVLGYSTVAVHSRQGDNPGFEWWLQAIGKAAEYAIQNNIQLTTTLPDPDKYSSLVDAMVTTRWGQTEPYNNLCPMGTSSGEFDWQNYGSNEGRCVTGCVATAMAQVMNYHQYPVTGTNTTHSVMVNGQICEVHYGQENYDWANMLDEYIGVDYTEEEGRAVALLMLHCGVAADMEYATDGSGTYTSNAVDGLHRNFGFGEEVQMKSRFEFSETDWMDMVYNELNSERPIIYCGVDMSIFAGHAFVLDGYDETGKVHVNWGWNGRDDGFFDISLLNPPGLQFSAQQDMIIGIDGPKKPLKQYTLDLTKPGQLSQLIPEEDRLNVDFLKLSGPLNSSDLKVLRQMSGRSDKGKSTRGRLSTLDLEDAYFVKDAEPFLEQDDRSFCITADNALPDWAFMTCRSLVSVKLPKNISYVGEGVFGRCSKLREMEMGDLTSSNVVCEDGVIYSKDKKEIISVLPFCSGDIVIESTVERIHDYAFAGCGHLRSIKVRHFTPIPLDENVFMECSPVSFILPAGSKKSYEEAEGWNKMITPDVYTMTYGSCLTVRNSARYYGDENPTLRYNVQGEKIKGQPILTCEATQTSPVGQYPIHIERGTVEGDDIFFIDGSLKIGRVPLTVSVADASRPRYEDDPEFTITAITGFVLNEDESVIKKMPTVYTNAKKDSPEGEYKFFLKDGEADNYFFEYDGKAVFTVTAPTAISEIIASGKPVDIYTADGILVRKQALTTDGLTSGVYLINGRKVVIR